MTFCLARRKAPCESEKVMTRGKASGITEIAKAIAKISKCGMSESAPSIKILAITTKERVMRVVRKINLLIRSTPFVISLTF